MFNATNGYSLADIAAASGNCNDGLGNGNSWWVILLFLFLMNGWGWGNNGRQGGATTREEVAYGFDMNGLENGVRGIQSGLCDGFYALNNSLLTGFGNQALNTQQGFAGVDNSVCTLGYQTAQLANGISSDISSATNALAGQLNAGFNGVTAGLTSLGTQMASCCCETGRQIERGFCDTNYNMATNTRDVIQSTHSDTDRILARIDAMETARMQEKIAALQTENQSLKFQASQCAQNAYLVDQLGQKAPVAAYTVPNPYCNCNSMTCC